MTFLLVGNRELYRAATIHRIDSIDGLKKLLPFVSVFDGVKNILLYSHIVNDTRNDDSRLLIHEAWTVNLVEQLPGITNQLGSIGGGGVELGRCKLLILRLFGIKTIGCNKNGQQIGYRMLLAQFLGAS